VAAVSLFLLANQRSSRRDRAQVRPIILQKVLQALNGLGASAKRRAGGKS
jgi:hypothetical protein